MSASAPVPTPRPAWALKVERGSALALRMMIAVVRSLGRRTGRTLLHPIVAYYLLTDGRARRAARGYFAQLASTDAGRAALGHAPGWRDLYRNLLDFSISLFDRTCVWAGHDDDFTFLHRGAGHFEHLPDAGDGSGAGNRLGKQGALILSAHVGTFELMRVICHEAAVPVNAVVYGANAETFNNFLNALNPQLDLHLIHVRPGAHAASLEVRAAIERGEFVAIMADRVGLDGRGTQRIPFLGAPARFSEGPFQLALAVGCPIMVAFALRRGEARYEVISEPLYAGGRVPRAERAKVVRELMERYARSLEQACLSAPHQWFNFFDFWEA